MGFIDDAIGFITGRNPKEMDAYLDEKKVNNLKDDFNNISSVVVSGASTEVISAIERLNAVPGVKEYVGPVSVSDFDSMFAEIDNAIKSIGNEIDEKASAIKAYSEAPVGEKFFATLGMGGAKIGEGVLSVFEDLGDGVASVVGFVSGVAGNTDLQKSMSDFIQKDWSHDAFNFYYNSDLANKSVFTEDSLAASLFEIAGSTAGYLAIGGAVAGWYGMSTEAAAGVVAGVGGLGTGTESGLKSGKSFNEAFGQGLIQGTVQGSLAYGAGKLSKHLQKNALAGELDDAQNALTTEQAHLNSADEAFNTAQTQLEEGVAKRSAYNEVMQAKADVEAQWDLVDRLNQSGTATREEVEAAYNKANSLWAKYQNKIAAGDSLFGQTADDLVVPSVSELEALQADATAKFARKNFAEQAVNAAQSSVDDITTRIGNVEGYTDSITNAGKNVGASLSDDAIGTIKNAVRSAVSSGPVGIVKSVVTAPRTVGTSVVQAATTLGGTTAIANSVGREIGSSRADAQFRAGSISRELNGKVDDLQPVVDFVGNDTGITPVPVVDSPKVDTPKNVDDTTRRTPTGGSSSGGSNSGGNSGGSTAPTYTPKAEEQFKKDTGTGKDSIVEVKPTESTTPEKPTSTQQPEQIVTPPSHVEETQPITQPTGGQTGGGQPTGGQSDGGYQGTYHSGGGYSESEGYVSNYENGLEDAVLETENPASDASNSIEDIIKGGKYTKIPTSSVPITARPSGSTGSAVIPIAAGLSAAAAAGIGAKAYMDRKHNSENGEDDSFDDEEEWDGDLDTDISYDDTETKNEYEDLEDEGLDEYQALGEEKYGARNNEELADLQ